MTPTATTATTALLAAIDFLREADRDTICTLRQTGEASADIEAAHRAQKAVLRTVEHAARNGADPLMLCRLLFRTGGGLLAYTAARVGADGGIAWNDMILDARKGYEAAAAAGESPREQRRFIDRMMEKSR